MKKILFVIGLLFSLNSFCQKDITTGMSGSQFRAAINSNFDSLYVPSQYNAKRYGLIGNGVIDNTSALQALINKVKVNGGTIFFPAGTYMTGSVISYSNVIFVGESPASTILKSNAAGTMISVLYDPNNSFGGTNSSLIEKLTLDGNNIGSTGLEMRHVAFTDLRNIIIKNFRETGVFLKGSLIGKIERGYFQAIPIGLYAEIDTGVVGAAVNLFQIKSSRFDYCSKWAMKWNGGNMIHVEDTDFEYNGTLADSTSGCIYFKDWQGHIGLVLTGDWFEMNNGICVFIDDNTVAAHQSIIESCQFSSNIANVAHCDIKVNGATRNNKVLLQSSTLREANSIRIFGNYASVVNFQSVLSYAPKLYSGGVYSIPIDINGYVTPTSLSSAPESPSEGMMYTNTTNHHLYYYNGSTWKQLDN